MSTTFESNGLHNGTPVYCPSHDWSCPYYYDGRCYIRDAIAECDDFCSEYESWENYHDIVDDNYDDIPDDVDESNYDPYLGQDFYDCGEEMF